ncbi:transcription repressor OFP15-like [Canna indica]|uniref:Transcription repressor n=1 Tax=Canna indica TaxID=4628 RepID=A0AAQ3QCI8_9LILI|nr:transcription repressor OFP15-like [Canna indica]
MRDTAHNMSSSSSSSSSLFSSSPPLLPPFPWPSCRHPRTRSFRSSKLEKEEVEEELSESERSSAAEWKSFSAASEGAAAAAEEAVIRGLRSERLFFEPGGATSRSILQGVPFEGSVAVAVESVDPYGDFRRSMQEMVMAHGSGGSGAAAAAWLEEMLGWYLKVNGKKSHGIILLAFLDLISSLPSPSSPSSSRTFGRIEEEDDVK